MSVLPVSPSIYFDDFSFAMESFRVLRMSQTIGEYSGLPNYENGKSYIHFLLTDCPDIQEGDTLVSSNNERYIIKEIGFDTYNGQNALLKAFY